MTTKNEAESSRDFGKACELGLPLGCLRVLQMERARAEALDAEAVQKIALNLTPSVQKICAATSEQDSACVQARQTWQELQRPLDPKLGRCQLNSTRFRNGGTPSEERAYLDPPTLSNWLDQGACLRKCNKWLQPSPEEKNLKVIRGRCQFTRLTKPQILWYYPPVNSECSSQGNSEVEEGHTLYAKCNCEERHPSLEIRSALETAGLFAVSAISYSKNYGASVWSRCAFQIFPDDAAAFAADKECTKKLRTVKKHLLDLHVSRDFDFNFTNLKCGNL